MGGARLRGNGWVGEPTGAVELKQIFQEGLWLTRG